MKIETTRLSQEPIYRPYLEFWFYGTTIQWQMLMKFAAEVLCFFPLVNRFTNGLVDQWTNSSGSVGVYDKQKFSTISCYLSHHCDETDDLVLVMFTVLPVELPFGCCFIKIPSKICGRKYCPSSLFMVESPKCTE